jgi:hypothetical protein
MDHRQASVAGGNPLGICLRDCRRDDYQVGAGKVRGVVANRYRCAFVPQRQRYRGFPDVGPRYRKAALQQQSGARADADATDAKEMYVLRNCQIDWSFMHDWLNPLCSFSPGLP